MSLSIETIGLSKAYGQVRAVDAVNLRVRQGEIYSNTSIMRHTILLAKMWRYS